METDSTLSELISTTSTATSAASSSSTMRTAAPDLSAVVVALLKGVLYRDESPLLWGDLQRLQIRVKDYVDVLGLDLILDDAEGYAFLRSRIIHEDDEKTTPIPRLVSRRPLSFPVSLLIALLRKKLAEFDAQGGDTRLVLSRAEILELVRVFLPENTNEVKLITQLDAHLNKIVDLGFLRKLKSTAGKTQDTFEVQRILKAFVDAQWLAEFDAKLAQYHQHAVGTTGGLSDE
jgi:hypothetical protein